MAHNILDDINATNVLSYINVGVATSSSLKAQLALDDRTIDNSLQRLRRNNLIGYDKVTKSWSLTETSEAFHKLLLNKINAESDETDEKNVADVSETSQSDSLMSDHQLASTNDAEEEREIQMSDNANVVEDNKTNIEDIDAQIAKAREAKGQKPAGEKRVKLTSEERERRKALEIVAKAEKQAARDRQKAEREAAKATKVAHMSKVDKAAERLPTLSDVAKAAFSDLILNLTAADITTLTAHLLHFNREQATQRALTTQVAVGDTVRIVSGEARYIGLVGKVSKAQRIRCYVDVEVNGSTKQVYLFTSDVERQEAANDVVVETSEAAVG